eukprot:30993-Pelagococcus_subviridis.AAC.4
MHDVPHNLVRQLAVLQRLIQRPQVRELLDDKTQRSHALRLQVVRAPRRAGVRHRLGVIRRVPPNLPQAPRARGLDVILRLFHERGVQRRDPLGRDHRRRERLRKRGDVPERHDPRQSVVALRLVDVIHERADAAVADDELRELRRVLRHLPDARRRVLPHEPVDVLQTHEDVREDLRLHDNLREIHRVLRDLPQRRAHLSLQLGVGGHDQRREIRDRAGVDDRLRHLRRVLRDVRQRARRDAFQRQLGLLHAQHEERHRASLHHLRVIERR